MGMYDDIVSGVSENIEINGHPFYAENIDGNEPYNRREYVFKSLLNGTMSVKSGKYVNREFSFKTTVYHVRPDEHDKIIREIMSKPVEVISKEMGGKFNAIVVFSKNIPDGSPNHTEYDVTVTEVPDKNSNIPGEVKLVVPDVKKITLEKKRTNSNKATLYNNILKKCNVPIKKNSKGKCVEAIQYVLNAYGYLKKKNMTGKYDSNTVKAVKLFQSDLKKKEGLKVTGIVDRKTRDSLLKIL